MGTFLLVLLAFGFLAFGLLAFGLLAFVNVMLDSIR